MMAITYGLMYSYSVFFKPLAEHFQWDRATVSLVYSVSLVVRGGVSIGIGWLADKYGARKLMIFCGIMMALGLILSSQVHSLWQFFLTYSLVEAIGLSGTGSGHRLLRSRLGDFIISPRGRAFDHGGAVVQCLYNLRFAGRTADSDKCFFPKSSSAFFRRCGKHTEHRSIQAQFKRIELKTSDC
jgi:MFS family permease